MMKYQHKENCILRFAGIHEIIFLGKRHDL